jgi:hypothetical protein
MYESGIHVAGLLEASDEELGVLRNAGFMCRDLRAMNVLDFFREVGIAG